MSWLSELLGGSDDKPKGLSPQTIANRKAREKERQAEKAAKEKWNTGLGNAESNAYNQAIQYFQSLGLDPNQHRDAIQQMVNQTFGGLQFGDNYSGLGGGIGQNVFDSATAAERTKAGGAVDSAFGANWIDQYIPDTADDSAIADILGEQRGEADTYLQNLFDRGVLTESGFQGGQKEIENQARSGQDLLSSLGSGLLDTGRGTLGGIEQDARGGAAGASLFNDFDIGAYTGQIDTELASFLDSLSGNLRTQAGDLFSTGDVLGKAGIAQGAQNLGQAKKPNAGILAQYAEDDEEEDRSATSTVF